jgi:hypothetical protein
LGRIEAHTRLFAFALSHGQKLCADSVTLQCTCGAKEIIGPSAQKDSQAAFDVAEKFMDAHQEHEGD